MKPPKDIKNILPKRKPSANKGAFGHVMVIAGSRGMSGAAYLASKAALLSGSGLLTLAVPKGLHVILAKKLTEAMILCISETKEGTIAKKAFSEILRFPRPIDAYAIGPGLARNTAVQDVVRRLLARLKAPVVLDADGLNAFEGRAGLLKKIKSTLVITPHPGELSRLTGMSVASIQRNRLSTAKALARRYGITVVLKGHNTVVVDKWGHTYVNRTGNPGMASGGMGDILSGMIASFLGQGIEPFKAAKLATYVHGLAGDLAADNKGQASLLASDVLDTLPLALKSLQKC